MTYTEVKDCIQTLGREGLEELIDQHGEEVIKAGLECGIGVEYIDKAYQGEYNDDEDFTEQLIDSIYGSEAIPSFVHVNWGSTAKDVMMDYCEDNGHYFRCL